MPAAAAAAAAATKVLLLDVDNTLYREQDVGIERQIVRNIHAYCQERCNLTSREADDLHRLHGSTIAGLQATKAASEVLDLPDFYERVYGNIDVAALLGREEDGNDDPSHAPATGYGGCGTSWDASVLRKLLCCAAAAGSSSSLSALQLILASNSPERHVQKVVQALGLVRVPWSNLVSPDRPSSRGYPTKSNPPAFFGSLLSQQPGNGRTPQQELILVDDSSHALTAVAPWMRGIRVSDDTPLLSALCQALGWLDPDSLPMDDANYLRAKNQVDVSSINREVWRMLQLRLQQLVEEHKLTSLCIADVGAGLLSMLKLFLQGGDDDDNNNNNDRLPALELGGTTNVSQVHYYAYESNGRLEHACRQQLSELGFEHTRTFQWQVGSRRSGTTAAPAHHYHQSEHVWVRQIGTVQWVVHVRHWEFHTHASRHQPSPHLVVGCCFADLIPPRPLAQRLVHRFLATPSTSFNRTLLYFPITFAGITQLLPPQPFFQNDDEDGRWFVPSDTTALHLYEQALHNDHGHNLDPHALVSALEDYGATLLQLASSDWTIHSNDHSYLWNAMLYFFVTTAGPELQHAGWDAARWLNRVRHQRPIIRASNVDLLLEIPRLGEWKLEFTRPEPPASSSECQEIQFRAPRNVSTVTMPHQTLEPTQVRIRSVASLISSGTELKIFTGSFNDAALDLTIPGMDDQRMAYPLAYGYSLVGRVVECGGLVRRDLLGKLVFAFAAHATHVVMDQDDLHVVPPGIDEMDAIFMPSVETALSLVQDANARFGERVAVFGQGLIGLLVTGILSLTSPRLGPSRVSADLLTTIDTQPTRLAASARMGSQQGLTPAEIHLVAPFDIAIEVSGNARALQTAIDSTRDGGLIVLGSWYGNSQVPLSLGIDFHRSHKTIKASQVSEIPAELRSLWTKERRFALTWDLVKRLQPSRLLTRRVSLDEAQDAYERLERGDEIAVAFDYKQHDWLKG